jgi:integrase
MPKVLSTELMTTPDAAVTLVSAMKRAEEYRNGAKAANTFRVYQSQRTAFETWCRHFGVETLPAEVPTIRAYIAHLAAAGRKPSTLKLALAAIRRAHEVRGYPNPAADPAIRETLSGVYRQIGLAQRQAKALLTEDLWRVLGALPTDSGRNSEALRGARDRALLLIGFGAALRRSELVALNVEDIDVSVRGVIVAIRRSKADQHGEGREVGIPNRDRIVSDALAAWMERAGITTGAIFRNVDRHGRVLNRLTDHAVRLIVKERLAAAGIDPEPYSGHSLRAGLATSAALNGANEASIRKQTGHKSPAMVHRYIRVADMWRNNAAEKVGL